MITENTWAVTKSEIDRVVNQARAERARVLRAAGAELSASIKRLFAGFLARSPRKGAVA